MTRRSPGNLRVAVARARVRAVAGAKSRHHRYAEGEIFATRLPALLQNADPSGSAPSTAAKNALAPLAKLHRSTPPFWPIGPPAAPSESQTEMAQVSRALRRHGKPHSFISNKESSARSRFAALRLLSRLTR